MTDTEVPVRPRDLDTTVGRLVEALAGAMDLYALYLGDALGLHQAREDGSP